MPTSDALQQICLLLNTDTNTWSWNQEKQWKEKLTPLHAITAADCPLVELLKGHWSKWVKLTLSAKGFPPDHLRYFFHNCNQTCNLSHTILLANLTTLALTSHLENRSLKFKGAMKTRYKLSLLEKLLCPDNNGTNFMANWINSGDIKQNMLTSGSSLATFQQLFSVASQSHVCAIGNCQTNPSLRQMTAWL